MPQKRGRTQGGKRDLCTTWSASDSKYTRASQYVRSAHDYQQLQRKNRREGVIEDVKGPNQRRRTEGGGEKVKE